MDFLLILTTLNMWQYIYLLSIPAFLGYGIKEWFVQKVVTVGDVLLFSILAFVPLINTLGTYNILLDEFFPWVAKIAGKIFDFKLKG
jgi:hypothetical protein